MLDFIAAQLAAGLKSDIFGGVAAAGIMTAATGFVLYQVRSLPGRIWKVFERFCVVTLVLREDDDAFHTVSLWLASHPSTRRTRSFQIVQRIRYGGISEPVASGQETPDDEPFYKLTPGQGTRWFRHDGRWWILARDTVSDQPTQSGQRPNERITLRTWGFNREPLDQLLAELTKPYRERADIAIYHWQGQGYRRVRNRTMRPLDTVHIAGGAKERIVADLERFYARREWYAHRAIPWRRGLLLTGDPGTGKSSLIVALAGFFRKSIYVIQPSMVTSDSSLHDALNEAGSGMVVIEDADTFSITHSREAAPAPANREWVKTTVDEAGPMTPAKAENGSKYVTLSGLLNAIDGIASEEGRVLIVTTNKPDALDPALLRPGRLDRHEIIGLADEGAARAMFERWFPGADPTPFIASLDLPITPAVLQERLLALTDEHADAHALQDRLADAVAKDSARDAA